MAESAIEKFVVVTGRKGYPTLCAQGKTNRYIHSLYDPIAEATRIVDAWALGEGQEHLYIFGLGLGYHVLESVQRCPNLKKVTVIECYPQIVEAAKGHPANWVLQGKIEIICPENEQELRQLFQTIDLNVLCLHPASVECMPYKEVQVLLQEMKVLQTSTAHSVERLNVNFHSNLPTLSPSEIISGLQGVWKNRPGILVAAGPSLDSALPHLTHFASRGAVVLAATRALGKLLANKVKVTATVATESNEILTHHFIHLPDSYELPPLLALSTVHPQIAAKYKGKVKWVLQSGLASANEFARFNSLDTFLTGGSVSTLMLHLLYYFGCDPIIFVGQDLAYLNGRSHADDRMGKEIPERRSYVVETMSVHDRPIETSLSWNIFRRWIEKFIEDHPERRYINTSDGAHITGTQFRTWQDLNDTLNAVDCEGYGSPKIDDLFK